MGVGDGAPTYNYSGEAYVLQEATTGIPWGQRQTMERADE